MKPALVILAAGIGSRYGSLKQLDKIGPSGETIIDYSVYDALLTGFEKIIFVIRESTEKEFKKFFLNKLKERIPVDYVLQEISMVPEGIPIPEKRERPWGTGHAVLMAADRIRGPFAVINADDFYGRGAFLSLVRYYDNWSPDYENDYCMVSYSIGNTLSEHGPVSRGVCKLDRYSNLVEITEQTHIIRKPDGKIVSKNGRNEIAQIQEDSMVSMNFWGFTPSFFRHLRHGFNDFIRDNASSLNAEFYIPTTVNNLVKSKLATVKILNCQEQWFGMTYKEDKEQVIRKITERIGKKEYPEKLWG
jgi:UTP-glucose-1-phosphate uridylyltransferase